MPQVTAEVWLSVTPDLAFAVSQTTGPTRLRWDPFIRSSTWSTPHVRVRMCGR